MKKLNNKKQKGFSILAVILVIVAVIVAIGIWSLSGNTNTNNTNTNSIDIQANSILNDANAINSSFDTLVTNGINPDAIVFIPNTASTNTAPNMLDPTTGIQSPKVNPNAIKDSPSATEGYWVYNKTTFKMNGIGTAAGPDYVLLLAGIKKSVCERINYILNGNAVAISSPVPNSASITTGATTTTPTTSYNLDMTGSPQVLGMHAACLKTTAGGDDNFFYYILKPN